MALLAAVSLKLVIQYAMNFSASCPLSGNKGGPLSIWTASSLWIVNMTGVEAGDYGNGEAVRALDVKGHPHQQGRGRACRFLPAAQ